MREAIVAATLALGLGAAFAQEADSPACSLLPGEASGSVDCPGISNPYVPVPVPERIDPGYTGSMYGTPYEPELPDLPTVAPGGELPTPYDFHRSGGQIDNPRVHSPALR